MIIIEIIINLLVIRTKFPSKHSMYTYNSMNLDNELQDELLYNFNYLEASPPNDFSFLSASEDSG